MQCIIIGRELKCSQYSFGFMGYWCHHTQLCHLGSAGQWCTACWKKTWWWGRVGCGSASWRCQRGRRRGWGSRSSTSRKGGPQTQKPCRRSRRSCFGMENRSWRCKTAASTNQTQPPPRPPFWWPVAPAAGSPGSPLRFGVSDPTRRAALPRRNLS